jgi:hypothetical protein
MTLLQEWLEIELVFLGEGRALSALKERAHGMGNATFLPYQSSSVARLLMTDASRGIVSLNAGIYRYAFPSKTMTYLAEGCPLLVSFHAGGAYECYRY